ncbi:MAG: MTAP family purine nucleoside phosphorylase [Candidatus Micrarchaeota archaeon]
MKMLGVIGGTGFERFFTGTETEVETQFGRATLVLREKEGLAFLSRHDFNHSIPSHKINSKANVLAFKKLGVRNIVAINSCGVLSKYRVGDLVLLKDFLAFHITPTTFFDKLDSLDQHVFMNPPFSESLGKKIVSSSRKAGVELKQGGVVAFNYGPRFETPAELKAFAKLGANLVGMTTPPEAVLCREAGLEYACIAVASNLVFGKEKFTIEGMLRASKSKSEAVRKIVLELAAGFER